MSKRILVVEDQPDNRQIIRDMLAPTDYEITEAEDGEKALESIAKQRPDLILMDIQLPIIDFFYGQSEASLAVAPSLDGFTPLPVSCISGGRDFAGIVLCNNGRSDRAWRLCRRVTLLCAGPNCGPRPYRLGSSLLVSHHV